MTDDPNKENESYISDFENEDDDFIESEPVESGEEPPMEQLQNLPAEAESPMPVNAGEADEDIYSHEDFDAMEEPSYVEDEDIYAYTDEAEDDLSSLEDDALFDEDQQGFDPKNRSSMGTVLIVILLLLLGGGGFYFLSSDILSDKSPEPISNLVAVPPSQDISANANEEPVAAIQDVPVSQENPDETAVVVETEETFLNTDDLNSAGAEVLEESSHFLSRDNISIASVRSSVNFNVPQPEISEEPFNFENIIEVTAEPAPEQEDLEVAQRVLVENSDENAGLPEEISVEAINSPEEIMEFFDAEESDSYSALSTFEKQDKIASNPRREQMAKFVVVENTIKADTHTSELTMAQRALDLGRYEAALGFYDKLYNKNRRDPRILLGRAVALQKTGRPSEALKAYEEALDLYPDNSEALVNYLGLMNSQYPESALKKLQRLHRSRPDNPDVAAQLGIAYANMNDAQKARQYLRMAASMDPQNAQHQYNIAIVAERAGDRRAAVAAYEKALEIDAIYGGHDISREVIYDRLSVLR